MKSLVQVLAMAAAALFLNGCASNATTAGMTVEQEIAQNGLNTKFSNSVQVDSVNGGLETNPMWVSRISNNGFKEALENSLKNAGYDADDSKKARYALTATLKKVQQPAFGFSMTVTSVIEYVLTNIKTGKIIFDQELTAPYTAKFSAALYGPTRLRLANEGSAKENIKMLLADFRETDPTAVNVKIK
jgi:PBP1b-binding outer membrane lipoprotein LpoB